MLRLVVLTVARLHAFSFCLFWIVHQARLCKSPLSAAQETPRSVEAYHFPNILEDTFTVLTADLYVPNDCFSLLQVSLLHCAFVSFCDTSTSDR